ncbi:unnamed protein product [Oreochromis niloticus]|nr:unnamed protein product [Mustela putorius furo]
MSQSEEKAEGLLHSNEEHGSQAELERASPEAELQPSADSGPLETRKLANPMLPENSEPSQQSFSAESLGELTQPPPPSVGSFCELCQPAEHCTLLLVPEPNLCAAQLQSVSSLPEACAPAGSVSASAGGSEGPIKQPASAGWPEEQVQPSTAPSPTVSSPAPAVPPTAPSPTVSSPAPTVLPATATTPLPAVSPPAPSPAASTMLPAMPPPAPSPAAFTPPPAASPSTAATVPSGPAPSLPGPASATSTPLSDPARPDPPRLCRPLSRALAGRLRRRGRSPERGRPPERGRRHCLPRGRPLDLFRLRCRRCPPHGRRPDMLGLFCWPLSHPPELLKWELLGQWPLDQPLGWLWTIFQASGPLMDFWFWTLFARTLVPFDFLDFSCSCFCLVSVSVCVTS